MDSAEVPAPLQQHSNNLVCDVCNIECNSPERLNSHYGEPEHKIRSKYVARYLFGLCDHMSEKRITCLDDIYNNRNRIGSLIGLQYLREVPRDQENPSFSCNLCDVGCFNIFQHVISVKHKKNYIQKHFSFLFGNIENLPFKVIAKIAVVIQDVEGIQKYKTAIKNPIEVSASLEYPCRETLNKIVEQLKKHKIGFKNPYQEGNTVPCLATGSHSSGTNEKKTIINPSVTSEPSAASVYSSRQKVNDKITEKVQIHGIGFKDAYQKENTVSCLETESHASGINERTGKRPSQLTPLAAFKRLKSDKMHDMAPKPIPSLCSSYRSSSRWFYQNADYGFRYSEQSLYDFANKPVYRQENSVSDVGQAYAVVGQTLGQETGHPGAKDLHTMETTGGSVSSPEYPSGQCSTEASLKQDPPSHYGYNSVDCKELSSKSYLPSGIMSVLNKEPSSPTSHAVESQTWGQETGHPGAKHLHTLEMTAGSVSSPEYPSGQCSTEASLKQDTPSHYGYNSVNSKELSSKSYLPSGITSVLNKESSSPTSHGAIHHSEGLPPTTSTSSCVQTSQSTNSSMPAKTTSVLSPDTLKILQGRDRTSVKSILKRLAEYCPELQKVDISLLVDILFESKALC